MLVSMLQELGEGFAHYGIALQLLPCGVKNVIGSRLSVPQQCLPFLLGYVTSKLRFLYRSKSAAPFPYLMVFK